MRESIKNASLPFILLAIQRNVLQQLRPHYFVIFFADILIFHSFGSIQSLAQEQLPGPDSVIARYIEVTGGLAKYKKIKSGTTVTTAQIGGKAGIRIRAETVFCVPGKYHQKVWLNDALDSERGSDGKTRWIKSSAGKYRIEEVKLVNDPILIYTLRHFTNPERYHKSRKTIERSDVEGESCILVKSDFNDGSSRNEYFSEKTGMLVKCVLDTGLPNVSTTTYLYEDYFESRFGIKFARTYKILHPLQGSSRLEKIDINPNIDYSKFELPNEVRLLLDKN